MKDSTATTATEGSVFTMDDFKRVIAAMPKPLPTIALNPYLSLPLGNVMTLADEKEAGTLPPNIVLSKAVPLLTGYVFDDSLLEIRR